jgi:ADP-ribosylglycohydrolase
MCEDEEDTMLGAIIGDVIGSAYEWRNVKSTDFELFSSRTRFTDDTVLTVAVADAVMYILDQNPAWSVGERKKVYASKLKEYGRKFPDAGYGHSFKKWLDSSLLEPYGSYGNGSAMRVSPIGYAFDSLDEVLEEAKLSAAVTHNHREGIKGAQAVASAVFIARTGGNKGQIKEFIEKQFKYDLSRKLDDIRPDYKFDSSCQGSVPQAITAFLESEDYEDVIRKAISIGGDSDTIACIAGGIAQAYYKEIPKYLIDRVWLILDPGFKRIISQFNERYNIGR